VQATVRIRTLKWAWSERSIPRPRVGGFGAPMNTLLTEAQTTEIPRIILNQPEDPIIQKDL
jgi:hypothetical protein